MGVAQTLIRSMLAAVLACCFYSPSLAAGGAEYFMPNAAPAAKSKASAAEDPASNSKKLNIYFWRGHGIEAGYLTNKAYMRVIKAICRKHNFRFDLRPDKDKLLAGLAWADVAYGTVHAGFSPTILKHCIQAGPESDPNHRLTDEELAAWRKDVGDKAIPAVIFLGGCNAMTERFDRQKLPTIREALGFDQGVPQDKVIVGWGEYITGVIAERIIRLTLAHWLVPDKATGEYRGFKQAMDAGMAYAEYWENTYTPNADTDPEQKKERMSQFINRRDKSWAEAAIMWGNPDLSLPQALQGRAD